MFSNFFIKRPRFAMVLSLVITLIGIIAYNALPVERYPTITPPQIVVRATYPGANAETIEKTIAAVVESEINGVEDMIYMQSSCSNGGYELNVYFEVGTDTDMAMVRVQNRLNLAVPRLPQAVRDQGLVVKERSGGVGVLVFSISSKSSKYDDIYLHNYASINIKDILSRVPGVGEVSIFGNKDYGIRVWLNPIKMANLSITTSDVMNAIASQNIEVPVGNVGEDPAPDDQQFQYIIRTKGRFSQPEEFENIIVRANTDGSSVKIKDIARVELGANNYGVFSRKNGSSAIGISVSQLADANLIEVVKAVKAELKRISDTMPEGIELEIIYDAADYVDESMNEVIFTLVLALVLVGGVIYLFLQNTRATFIPVIAIPISIIGTFAFLKVFDFSINTFTMFGLALAIGIVVDDAIVVIENVQRHLADGMSPKDATYLTMKEVSGAIIATTLVLMAVFVPVTMMPGISGKMYKQFATTIAVSVGLSAVVALTLTPALCSLMLRRRTEKDSIRSDRYWGWFNYSFETMREKYLKVAYFLVHRSKIILVSLLALIIAAVSLFKLVPGGFFPEEDQGFILAQIQLPEGASLARTDAVVKKVEKILENTPEVNKYMSVPGFSGSNTAMVFTDLKKWKERKGSKHSVNAVIKRLQVQFAGIQEATIYAFVPPSVPGLGMFGGFDFQLQDKGDNSSQYLAQKAGMLIGAANQNPKLERVFTLFQANLPQLNINIDREKALAQGVNINDILSTIGAQFGSAYINDFNKMGRVFQVKIQADSEYRNNIDDISSLYVRNKHGEMVPISTFVSVEPTVGPQTLNRFNMFRSVAINGSGKPGVSSGEAIVTMQKIAKQVMPADMGYEWSGTARQELETSGQIVYIIFLALLFVYLFLVALYESWTLPFGVILTAPVAVVGGLLAQLITGLSLDLYCQIGLIMLVGMATKNAILIIEFAKTQKESGVETMEAALSAAKLRFRAVLMTAFTFVCSAMPLVVATGAGAAARHSIGVTIVGGMIATAIVGTIFVPPFYVVVENMKEAFHLRRREKAGNTTLEKGLNYEK